MRSGGPPGACATMMRIGRMGHVASVAAAWFGATDTVTIAHAAIDNPKRTFIGNAAWEASGSGARRRKAHGGLTRHRRYVVAPASISGLALPVKPGPDVVGMAAGAPRVMGAVRAAQSIRAVFTQFDIITIMRSIQGNRRCTSHHRS